MNKRSFMGYTIILPGWGVPISEYEGVGADLIVDYGFWGNTPLSLEAPSEWLDSLIPNGKSYRLIAHSMGALFALRTSQLRDSASEIIICGGFSKFVKSDDNIYGQPPETVDLMLNQLKKNPFILLKSFYRTMNAPDKRLIKMPNVEINNEQLEIGLNVLKNCDIRNDLSSINLPVKIFHGEDDRIASYKLANELTENISNSSCEILPAKGHSFHFFKKLL